MPHKDVLLSLILDGLDGVDHPDVFAHLEGDLSRLELDILETLLSNNFVELLRELCGGPRDFHAL